MHKEAFMPVGDDNPPALRSTPSEIDRRAIGAAGQLLVAGIWLERQFGNAPKVLTGLVAGTGPPRPLALLTRTNPPSVNQRLREAPSTDPAPSFTESSPVIPREKGMTTNASTTSQGSGRYQWA
jgi:hypothetical protein